MHIVTQDNNTPVLGESCRVGVPNSCHWSQRLNSDTTTCRDRRDRVETMPSQPKEEGGGWVGERDDDDRQTRSLLSVGGSSFL